ncbi:MAG: zinc-binding dehydrogenase [bacterium]|nr:zinc-binding dehydrogenase [bacterium]
MSDETAVMADPFSVALHAILRTPPAPGGWALVYGCGTLGLLAIQVLRALHPDVRIAAIARFPHQAELAREFGASSILSHHPPSEVLESAAKLTGASLVRPWRGLPVLNGGVDVVYDTVSSPETLEVGLRLVRSRGSIVVLGVEPARRFEWTPLYFKEVCVVGSSGFGVEQWQGRKQHAMNWLFEFAMAERVDPARVLTHRFPLENYKQAFMTCYRQADHGAVKVVFDRF